MTDLARSPSPVSPRPKIEAISIAHETTIDSGYVSILSLQAKFAVMTDRDPQW